MISANLESTVRRALMLAAEHQHKYATLEHLLCALIEDPEARTVMESCAVNLDKLQADVTKFLDEDLARLAPQFLPVELSVGSQRVMERAATHIKKRGGVTVTGANVLVALFSERESHAVYFLEDHAITRHDAINFLAHGIMKELGASPAQPTESLPTVSWKDASRVVCAIAKGFYSLGIDNQFETLTSEEVAQGSRQDLIATAKAAGIELSEPAILNGLTTLARSPHRHVLKAFIEAGDESAPVQAAFKLYQDREIFITPGDAMEIRDHLIFQIVQAIGLKSVYPPQGPV